MPFRKYDPDVKALAVKMALEKVSLATINQLLSVQISKQSMARWKQLYHRTHSVIVDPATYKQRSRPLKISEEEREFLLNIIDNQPSLYIDELQKILKERGIMVSETTIHRELKERLGLTIKVARTSHPAQDFAARAKYFEEIGKMPSDYPVFTDESLICTKMQVCDNTSALKGHRTNHLRKFRSSKKYHLLPAVTEDGVISVLCQEGGINVLDFEYFLEKHLLPVMNPYPGPLSILVTKDREIHKGKRITKLCRNKGIRYVFLPPYSPDLNPIEKAVETLKIFLKRRGEINGCAPDVPLIKNSCLEVMNGKLLSKCFSNCGH